MTQLPPPPPPCAPPHDEPLHEEPEYDPHRTVSLVQMEASMNLLVHPVWIFDYRQRQTRWGNQAAVALWNASSLEELVARDFSQISKATTKRNDELLAQCERGHRVLDQWTFYPKGQAKTVRVSVSGVQLEEDVQLGDGHVCFFVEAIPVEVKGELDNQLLRGVEMLRHLPIAVCQFNMEGSCMFQNPAATLLDDSQSEHDNGNESEAGSEDCTSETISISESTEATEPEHPQNNDSHEDSHAQKHKTRNTSKKRKQTDTSLFSRFVDPTVGHKVMKQVHEQFQSTPDTGTITSTDSTASNNTSTSNNDPCLELEAMLHSQKGPTWSAIQIRQSIDPVTGQAVLLYNARDKTDAIQAQKEKRAREEKAEFLAVMAHEIRTPLHQVTGFVDLLDQTRLDKEQKSFVGVLKSSAQGLIAVINDVLDYSKLEAGHMKLESIPYEPLSVTKGSLEAVRASCEERGIYLKLDWDTMVPFKLKNDPNRLRQILLNLLSNSVKFTKKGGITVKTSYITSADTSIITNTTTNGDNSANTATTTDMIKFTVTDTGIGISKEQMEIVFQKYQQADATIARNYGGTGLGLSICHSLVGLMGGTMGVESQVGQGTSFWLVLPATLPTEKDLAGEEEEEALNDEAYQQTLIRTRRRPSKSKSITSATSACPRTRRRRRPSLTCSVTSMASSVESTCSSTCNVAAPSCSMMNDASASTTNTCNAAVESNKLNANQPASEGDEEVGLNVLVAEDNKINQKLVVNMLRRLGHTVTVAENGKEAIDLVEQGGLDEFDVCLMDIQMPVCDGFEATKRLRSMGYTNLPIYGLTASVGRSDYVELGFNDWLPKPIRMKELKIKMYHLMKLRQENQQLHHQSSCLSVSCDECTEQKQ